MIELDDVTVAYGRTLALRSVSLEIAPGVTGLFGQNGSGKSTLLRVLTGLLRPSSGEVRIDGQPLDMRDEDFRRSVGYAGHEPGLYADLTVRENLELFGRLYGVDPSDITGTIERFALDEVGDAEVGTLSAGTKRRAAIARALLHEPRFLFLDEPYANLDDEAADRVGDSIAAWAARGGTGIVASHGAKRVKAYASAGIVLQRGNVSTTGTYAERFERT